jgi:hypothetical protein
VNGLLHKYLQPANLRAGTVVCRQLTHETPCSTDPAARKPGCSMAPGAKCAAETTGHGIRGNGLTPGIHFVRQAVVPWKHCSNGTSGCAVGPSPHSPLRPAARVVDSQQALFLFRLSASPPSTLPSQQELAPTAFTLEAAVLAAAPCRPVPMCASCFCSCSWKGDWRGIHRGQTCRTAGCS